jgi:phosphopantothenoylcysteine synthetase/decarboxylase
MSHPSSKKMKQKPLFVCPGCSKHMYSNNMVNRYNILIKLQAKILQNDPRVRKKITEQRSGGNLRVGVASTCTTEGEACLASFFFCAAGTLDFDSNI